MLENLKATLAENVTITKRELTVGAMAVLLAGIVFGLFYAPITDGFSFSLFSNNGNESGNGNDVEERIRGKKPDNKNKKCYHHKCHHHE